MDSEKNSCETRALDFLRARKKCCYESPVTNLKRVNNKKRKLMRLKRRAMSPETREKNQVAAKERVQKKRLSKRKTGCEANEAGKHKAKKMSKKGNVTEGPSLPVEDTVNIDSKSSICVFKEEENHVPIESSNKTENLPNCIIKEEFDAEELTIKEEPLDEDSCVSEEALIPDVIIKEEKEEVFECEECNKKFTELRRLESHKFIHKRLFKCGLCEKTYFQLSDLNKHKRNHTEEGKKTHVCGSCKKLSKKPNTEEDFYRCTICKHYFYHLRCLNNHIRYDHNGEKPYICSICEKCFLKPSYVWAHQKLHLEKPFICSECHRSFPDLDQLKSHEIVHRTSKKYECKFCKKRFSMLKNFKNHENMHDHRFVIIKPNKFDK